MVPIMIAVQTSTDILEKRLHETFQSSARLADAKKVLELMQKSRLYQSWLGAFIVFAFAAILFVTLDSSWVAYGLALAALCVGFREQSVVKKNTRKEVVKARAELEVLMEFSHTQFPYWKGIAEKLKKILDETGSFRKSMLPPHVLNGGH